jgi:hypothetical protein
MSNQYTAYKNGKVCGHGTFTNIELLKIDYPAPEYDLKFGCLEFPEEVPLTYQELRRKAYPPPSELADALYWQSKNDNTKMEAYLLKCEEVKLMYPKPD